MTKIATTPELLGTFIKGDNATSKFAANPAGYLADLGIDAGIEVKAVKNTGDTINLALPYYAELGKTAGKELSDSDLEAASGGAGDIPGNNAAVQVGTLMMKVFNIIAHDTIDMLEATSGSEGVDHGRGVVNEYLGERK